MQGLQPPFFQALEPAKRVLIAGAGGGFDVFCGLPLYFALERAGKQVFLANLSFSMLAMSKQVHPMLHEVTADSKGFDHYFPERHLAHWFRLVEQQEVSVYGFENEGVRPLEASYRFLVEHLKLDTVILVDGGTDSLMRGDEAGLGTPEEDAASLAAVNALDHLERRFLVCLGFGVDAYHGVCHAQFLEAVADLTASGAYLGAWSLTPDMPDVKRYNDASEFVFGRMPNHPSIVSTSILDGIRGEFGDFHRTVRTRGSTLFINPLMGLYWAFDLEAVARRNLYLHRLHATNTRAEVRAIIEDFRETRLSVKPWQAIPH